MKYSDIIITPLGNNRYKVQKTIFYKDITVPIGFRTNGADVPRIFWSVIPPNQSEILPAVIVHDYLFEEGEYEKANTYFKDILDELSVSPLKKMTLYYSVVLYTKFIKGKSFSFYSIAKRIAGLSMEYYYKITTKKGK